MASQLSIRFKGSNDETPRALAKGAPNVLTVPACAGIELVDARTQRAPAKVQATRRGNDLHLKVADEAEGGDVDVVLAGYFEHGGALVGTDASGSLVQYATGPGQADAGYAALADGASADLAPVGGAAPALDQCVAPAATVAPWALAAFGALGLVAMSGGSSAHARKPATATIQSIGDDDGNDRPTVRGIGTPGDVITVTWPSGEKSQVVVDPTGNWSIESPHKEGSGPVTAVAQPPGGEPGPTATGDYRDTTPPGQPGAIHDHRDGVTPILDDHSTARYTNDPRLGLNLPTDLTGSSISFTQPSDDTSPIFQAAPNLTGTVNLIIDGQVVPSSYNPATGLITPANPLTGGDKTYKVSYSVTDVYGNTSPPSPESDYKLDTQPPALTINPSNGGTISGTAEAGASIAIDANHDGTPDYFTTADSSGNWSVVNAPLVTGGSLVNVTARDPAGNGTTRSFTPGVAPSLDMDTSPSMANGIVGSWSASGSTYAGSASATGGNLDAGYTAGNVFSVASPTINNVTGESQITMDISTSEWGGNSVFVLTYAGVKYAEIVGSGGQITYFGGASGNLASVNAAAYGQQSASQHWVIDLPDSVAPSGKIVFSTTCLGGNDDDLQFSNTALTTRTGAPVSGTGHAADYYTVDGPISIAGTSNTIADSDSANMQSADVRLTNAQTGDRLLVNGSSAASGALASGITWANDGTHVTFSGAHTQADYQDALKLVQFENTTGNTSTATRTINSTVNDGASNSNVAVTTISYHVGSATPTLILNATNGGTLSGKADAGATVRIDANHDGTIDYTTTADSSGNWSVASAPLVTSGSRVDVMSTTTTGMAVSKSITPGVAPALDMDTSATMVDHIANGGFSSGTTSWTVTGGSPGAVEGGQYSMSVDTSAAAGGSSISQSGITGVVAGSQLVLDVRGEVTGGPGTTTHVLFGGVEYATVVVPQTGAPTVTYANGATGNLTTVPTGASTAHWVINLPSNVASSGTLTFAMDGAGFQSNDFNIDNVQILTPTGAPVAGTGHAADYYTASGPISIAGTSNTITDSDTTNMQSADVRLTNAQTGDHLIVNGSAAASGTLTSGIAWANDGTHVTFSGAHSAADYQDALKLVQFENTSGNTNTTSRTINTTVNDGVSNSNVAVTTVTYHVGTAPPVVLDLNGDGKIDYGHTDFDIDFNGVTDHAAWVAAPDGVLVWDKHGDGQLHSQDQFAFTAFGGQTDLEGLAIRFDTNHDGIFDVHDADFAAFKVWQDLNQDGKVGAGEMRALADWGITAIALTSDGQTSHPANDVTVHGNTHATLASGAHMLVSDVSFAYAPITQHAEQVRAAAVV